MQNYYYIRALYNILRKTAESSIKAVIRITHAMIGSTEGAILVSHIEFDVCSSLTLMHERYANMAELVKLRTKVSEVIFQLAVAVLFLCLR